MPALAPRQQGRVRQMSEPVDLASNALREGSRDGVCKFRERSRDAEHSNNACPAGNRNDQAVALALKSQHEPCCQTADDRQVDQI